MLFLRPSVFPLGAEETETPAGQAPEAGDNNSPDFTLDLPILDTETLRRRITNEASSELLSLELGDSTVSLLISGYWKGSLSAGWGMAFTPLGSSALNGESPFFTQEADLTLSLWIRDRWFVEGSFLDDYNLNTYRAGYQGFPGEIVQYAGVGNTGLDFPAFPYLDLGEASPSSFGFYSRLASRDLSVHGLIRYDFASREEKVFQGSRERSYGYVDLSPLRGISFVLPDSNLETVPLVYIQDRNGPLTDEEGRRWRMAESSEYAAGSLYGLLELSLGNYTGGVSQPEAMVAVSYFARGMQNPWTLSLGSYGTPDPDSPGAGGGSGFLGSVQKYFDRSGRAIELGAYPQCGDFSALNSPGEIKINGISCLVIYEKGSFSPFEKQNIYPVPTSSSAALVRLSSGEVIRDFEIVFDAENSPGLSSALARLIRPSPLTDGRNEQERWPLAAGNEAWPELYLPGRQIFTGDLGIRYTNYGTGDLYFIGTDIIPGSIQVFRDGLQDPDFSYNPTAGTVTLRISPGFNEIIRISFLRRSEERRNGSLSAGLGVIWDPHRHFSSRIGLGIRWNLSSDDYSEQGSSNPGTAGLGAEARWDYDRLKAGLTLGLGFEQPDTSGLYRAAGMEGNEIILGIPPGDSFITPAPALYDLVNRAPLIFRNYRETNILGASSLTGIESSAPIISGQSGPYAAMDYFYGSSRIQILAAEFELSQENFWTGFETSLGPDGAILERAKEIVVPFRFYGLSGALDKISVIFQAGALAEKDSQIPENPGLLIERTLYVPGTESASENPLTITINLNDEDRRRLQGAQYFRIIIAAPGLGSSETINGRVLLAPPLIRGAGFRPIIARNNTITAAFDSAFGSDNAAVKETIESGSGRLEDSYRSLLSRLNSGGKLNRVLEIAWEDLGANTSAGADTRLSAMPLDNYQTLSFFIRRPRAKEAALQDDLDNAGLHFLLAQGPQSLNNKQETILEAYIPLKALGSSPGKWAKLELRYQGRDQGIFMDGQPISGYPGSWLRYYPDFAGMNTSYLSFLIDPDTGMVPDGSMAIDEIILEEAVASYRLNTGANADWIYPGTVLSIRNYPVISGLALSAGLESALNGNPFVEGSSGYMGMNGRSLAEFSVLGLRVRGNFSYTLRSYGETGFSWRGGHILSRSWKLGSAESLSVQESFDHAPTDSMLEHQALLALAGPFRYSLEAKLAFADERLERRWQNSLGMKTGNFPLDISLGAYALWAEKSGEPQGMNNYASAWAGSWEPMLPQWGDESYKREGRLNFITDLGTLPLGFRLLLEGTSSFSGPDKNTLAIALGRMEFPWIPEINSRQYRFMFREEREFRRSLYYAGKDFRDDLGRFGEALGDSLPLVFSIPFYSFFNTSLNKTMADANSDLFQGASLYYGRFTDRFDISMQMPPNYRVSALFIPSRISLQMNRGLDQKMDVFQDTLGFGGNLGFSAINLFGAMGTSPLFAFYSSDQFSHYLDAAFSIPRGEKTGFRIQAGQDLNFYGFNGGELNLNHVLTVNSSNYISRENRWSDAVTISWLYPVKSSLLGTIYAAFMRTAEKQSSWLTLADISKTEYELLRREFLEFDYERNPGTSSANFRYSFGLGHESQVRLTGRLNLSSFARLNFSRQKSPDYPGNNTFSFLAVIGLTLWISF